MKKILIVLLLLIATDSFSQRQIPFAFWQTVGGSPPPGSTYLAESEALFVRMGTVSTARKDLIDSTIRALQTPDIWAELDLLYFFAAGNTTSALLNWTSSSYNCTVVGSPTFTANVGYTGDGSSTYLNTNYTPSTNAVNFQANAGSVGIWSNTALASNTVAMGCDQIATPGRIYITPFTGTYFVGSVNDSTTQTFTKAGSGLGFYEAERTSSTSSRWYQNGVFQEAATNVGKPRPAVPLYILAFNRDDTALYHSPIQIKMAYVGGSLTEPQHATLYSVAQNFLTRILTTP